MKKIGRKKKKALYKRLQQLDRKYEEIMEKSYSMEDALADYYGYGYWSPLFNIYVKLRYFLVLKWAEENHVSNIGFQEFPTLEEDEDLGGISDIQNWGENIQFQLMEDEYNCCTSCLIDELKVFGWEIDFLDFDEIELADSLGELDELLKFLESGTKETLLEILETECYDEDMVNFVFLKNHNLGKYYQCVKEKSNKSRVDLMLRLRVDFLSDCISKLLYHYIFDIGSSLSEEGEFCAVCAYGSFASMDAYLGLYEFDPINIIRAWYLKQYLEIAQRLYGY